MNATTTNATTMGEASSKKDKDSERCLGIKTSLARRETNWIRCLRLAVLSVLLIAAALASTGVYLYTRNQEYEEFTSHFEESARQIMNSFRDTVERNLGAAAAMSTAFTSHANHANLSFPFVTLPDFELRGSHLRIQSGSHVVHWLPLVTDDKRDEWESWALQNRGQINQAFQGDLFYRSKQDAEIGANSSRRSLQQQQQQQQQQQEKPSEEKRNMTILDEESGYHLRIWSNGGLAPEGDEPEGSGPYLPAWQRSPIDPRKEKVLNMNWAQTKAITPDLLQRIIAEKRPVLGNAAVPIPESKARMESNLRISQYREHFEDYIDGLTTFWVYPVFDSFDEEEKQVAGILITNVYWKVLLSKLLPSYSIGIICVIENSYNQTFSYEIDGATATFMGMDDHHDPKYDGLEMSTSVNEFLQDTANPTNRAYNTLPLSSNTQYRISIFPSNETQNVFLSNKPIIYTAAVACSFAFTTALFLAYSFVVERRHHIMLEKVVENAQKAAAAERELNEFLSHEVRNPLSAAISACSFVTAAVNEPEPLKDPETRKFVREDIEVVNSSLHFINDFLRSMLDIHRSNQDLIKIENSPTDIYKDVLEPISALLHQRVASFDLILACPQSLFVLTDSMRLKQVVLNLVRNSSKFVQHGFIRIRAAVVENQVELYVEDSGPGIDPDRQNNLFSKYQQCLDELCQGTGLGLNLSKNLMQSMGGDLIFDDTYSSGIEGRPGARFIVQLKTCPIDIESALVLTDSESDLPNDSQLENGLTLKEIREELSAAFLDDLRDGEKLTTPDASNNTDILPSELSVLFVDDDAILRKLFMRVLKKTQPGWTVHEAASGEAALQLCESETFDLIFLDQYMTSVGSKQLLGTETAQAMRSKGITAVICGLSANDIKDNFMKSGADEFMMKPMPCKPEVLRLVLSRLLCKRECVDTF